MQRSKYDIWVGLFVMLGILSIVFLALKVGNLVNFSFDKTYAVNAQFSNIGGVKSGSPVKSAGVVVGRVRSVVYDNEIDQAVANIELQSRYEFPVDSTLRILTSGLLGEEYISIVPGIEETTLEHATQQAQSTQGGAPLLVTRTQASVSLGEMVSQIIPGADGSQPLTGKIYTINARFTDIGSLKAGATVKSSGVIVGHVRSIRFDDHMFQAVATLDLQSQYAFPSDSSLKIMSSGLIGSQYVAVSPGIEDETLEEATAKAQAQNNGQPLMVTQTQSAIVLEDLIGQFLYNTAADKGTASAD
ncbi:putative phospholipid ABC transporter-binding protein MlaD [Saezia sanguinis]|uniref:Putative phospholipid ABC transporter-binding protein MlaD n=1 Tax=Saezia sanguinis TaxID=1965230 RepID=A0A433SC38_9BURK|nr:outer membrane lipid asymmetry maintenance protein MlaD [Saezia sanguinis]RUS66303.1 putative phospholipid ABC transporter-binding protein MlaD [Saezia sanguinis]